MKLCRRMRISLAGLFVVLGVLLPCSNVNGEEAQGDDIATILTNDERFHTASTLLKAAGLIDVLEGEGPYTVFIPSDEAFKTLPPGVFTDLIRFENKDKLENLLTYHIYAKAVSKEKLAGLVGQRLDMLNGKQTKISCKEGILSINKAKIIVADIKASNGVIHIIDDVLVPKG